MATNLGVTPNTAQKVLSRLREEGVAYSV